MRAPHGHDHVGLDLRHGILGLSGDPLAPPLLRAHVTAVRDDERGVFARLEGDVVRSTPADDHLDAALFEGFLQVLHALQLESVVAEVGLGVVVGMP
jgi:hypothetical protein